MKIEARQVEGFLRSPDPRQPVVLLHGPDAGLVQERAQRLGRAAVGDLGDPFRVSELSGDQLREEPRRLAEEAQALCLLGGRRLVRVRQAGDAARPALEGLLALPAIEALVVVEADELPASSKLRQLAEKSPQAAVIACWRDSERDLAGTLQALLAELGLEAKGTAFERLKASLGADRALNRRELEKLALYVGAADRAAPVAVTPADVDAAVGDAAAVAVDDAVYAALTGDPAVLDRALGRLLGEGVAPVRVLRQLTGVLLTLIRVQLAIRDGQPVAAAIAKQGWRVSFTIRDRFTAALRRHPLPRLQALLERNQELELQMKTAKAPDELLLRQSLLDLTRAGARSAR